MKYSYTVSNSLPLMAGNWFYIDELIPKINNY